MSSGYSGKAVRITRAGGPDVLEITDHVAPEPGGTDVLVQVAAAGLNRADLLQRRGQYPAPAGTPSDIPGLEYAGTIVAVGSGVTSRRVGDRVMGIVGGGAMATHVTVNERETIAIPEGMPFDVAAAIPEVFLTAFDALFLQGDLKLGETVLIHAVGSGVGTAAVQLARAAGARVAGTSRSKDKLERCKALGLDHPIFVDADGRFAGEISADVILDCVGAGYLAENLRALAPRGRLVCIGTLSGGKGELPLGMLLGKRATVIGSVLRSRPLEEKAALARRFEREALPLFSRSTGRPASSHDEGPALSPVLTTTLPMSRIAEAHVLMEADQTFGKTVLTWS